MSAKILIDTNLWVYLYAKEPQVKYAPVRTLIEARFESIILTSQVLGELYNVLTRKNLRSKLEAKAIILELTTTFRVAEIGPINVLQALDINLQYGYSYWDSLMVATALLNDCETLYSEDLHHQQIIEEQTQIINPLI